MRQLLTFVWIITGSLYAGDFQASSCAQTALAAAPKFTARQKLAGHAEWNNIGHVFDVNEFFKNENCYGSERIFLSCIHQVQELLRFLPGHNVLVPEEALETDLKGSPVLATFQTGKIVNLTKRVPRPASEREQYDLKKQFLGRWKTAYREKSAGQIVNFETILKWLRRQPFYIQQKKQVHAAVANAGVAILFDSHTRFLPRVVRQRLMSPILESKTNVSSEFGFVQMDLLREKGNIGLLRILSFGDANWGARPSPSEEVSAAVSALLEDGAKSLILDLRNNGGGSVQQAARVANLFMDVPAQGLIHLRYFDVSHGIQSFPVRPVKAKFPHLPLVILSDATTISSAELLAGALQDFGRAIVVGDTSFGKGTGQIAEIFENEPDVVLVRTVSMGVFPSGTSNDCVGVHPDVLSKKWGARLAYDVDPAREADIRIYEPPFPLPFPPRRVPMKLNEDFEACLKLRREKATTQSEIDLAADVLACWEFRS